MDLPVLCKYMEEIFAPPQVDGMDLCTLSKGVEKNLSTLSKYTE
jgi:hypothetical protein